MDPVGGIEIEGHLTDDSSLISSHYNEFYGNIATNIQLNMSQPDPNFGLDLDQNNHELLSEFDPITAGELAMVISSLKNNSPLSEIFKVLKFLKFLKFLKLLNLKLVPIVCKFSAHAL